MNSIKIESINKGRLPDCMCILPIYDVINWVDDIEYAIKFYENIKFKVELIDDEEFEREN